MAKRSTTNATEESASLAALVENFLADLRQANHSPNTVRAYASDLAQFATFSPGAASVVTVKTLRAFWVSLADLSPATRSRKQACLARFLTWAYRQDHIPANPIDKIDRVTTPPSKGEALPPLPPLRTVRETFASHGSSISKAVVNEPADRNE